MSPLLLKVIPLDLASTLSPGILALAIILLGSSYRPKLRTLVFLIGSLLVGVGIAIIGLTLGKAVPTGAGPSMASAIVDLVFGLVLIFLALKAFFGKERKIKSSGEHKHEILKLLLLGIIISITNFDAVFLSLTAAKEIGGSLAVNNLAKLILLAVNVIFFTLPISLPLAIYLIFPRFAANILAKINRFVMKYSKYLVFVLLIVFGIFLLYRGFKFFI